MSQLLLSRSPYRSQNGKATFTRRTLSQKNVSRSLSKASFEIGPMAMIFGLLFLAGFLGALQLMQYNKVSTKGYEMAKIEADRKLLLKEYERRNMQITEIQSLVFLKTTAKVVGMRNTLQVNYVHAPSALASNK